MIQIAFRFDDPSPVSKRHVEEHVFEAMLSHRIPLTCAVIPARLRESGAVTFTSETSSHLRHGIGTGLLEVALHGYLHREARPSPSGCPSEFAGVPVKQQKESIESGRALLEDKMQCPIAGFVPPWNSYDSGTVHILEEMGFAYLSADMQLPQRTSPLLRNMPLTCGLPGLEKAIAQARRFERFSPVIIVVMHHYDFERDSDDPQYDTLTYADFTALLERLQAVPQLRFTTLRVLADSLSAHAGRIWVLHRRLRNLLPYRYKHHIPDDCFLTRLLPDFENILLPQTPPGRPLLPPPD